MTENRFDIVVIGGGPAGMSAALAACEAEVHSICLIERDERLGGVLEQCIHSGFGLHSLGQELTGPEYAEIYENKIKESDVRVLTDTMVQELREKNFEQSDARRHFEIFCSNREDGLFSIDAKAVILASGCRERSRGALNIPGERPAGVYSAGTVQKFVNIMGLMPGREVVILGSGDIGLIMARRLTLEGAKVKLVCEIMKDSGGLTRNIVQCLDDYDIPLLCSHTVSKIHGKERLEGVTISEVDENLNPIEGTEEFIGCDTLLLSVGLIPETEILSEAGAEIDAKTKGIKIDELRQSSIEGVFACGNVTRVHELVDVVSQEGEIAGKAAAAYVQGFVPENLSKGRSYIAQQKGCKILRESQSEGENTIICTRCPNGCVMKIAIEKIESDKLASCGEGKLIGCTGNKCARGREYAELELSSPARVLTSTVRCDDGAIIPVKSSKPLPRKLEQEAMNLIDSVHASEYISLGACVIKDIAGSGIDIIATRSRER